MKILRTYKSYYIPIFKLGIPIVIGQLGQILLGFADNVMIGHYNVESLSAASFVNQIFSIPIFFGLGFSYGLTPIIAGLHARSNFFEIGKYLKNSLFINVLISFLMIGLMLIVLLNIHHLGQPTELIPLIKPYFIIQAASLIFIMLFNSLKQFSEGIKDVKTPMWVMLICQVLNIIGNYIFIYGKLGLPEMGLVGAGISTLFSRFAMVAILTYCILSKKLYSNYKIGFKQKGFSKTYIKHLNRMGFFTGLQMGLETSIFCVSIIMMGWLGVYALAAHQIACSITTIGFMVYYGIGSAIAICISNFIEKEEFENVKKATIAGSHIILLFVILSSIILVLIRTEVGYLFVNDENVVSLVATIMIPVILYQFSDGLQICFANVLRAMKDVKAMAILSFIGYFIIALPCCYLFAFVLNMKELGIWLGFLVGLTITGILFLLRYQYIIKRLSDKNW